MRKLINLLFSFLYSIVFKHNKGKLTVTGFVHYTNSNRIYFGKGVLLKRDCELLAGSKGGAIKIGNNSEIHEYVTLRTFGGEIKIGDQTSLNRNCILFGAGNIEIGNDVRIGPAAFMTSSNHNFKSREVTISKQGMSKKRIKINDDVWIGANVSIMPGVEIGEGAIVAAGAVVTSNLTPFCIYGGVPAKKIGER